MSHNSTRSMESRFKNAIPAVPPHYIITTSEPRINKSILPKQLASDPSTIASEPSLAEHSGLWEV